MDLTAIILTGLRDVAVDGGHCGRAAARCRVSRPTRGLQVRRLEEAFGARRFERRSVPDAAGLRLVADGIRARVAGAARPRSAQAAEAAS